MTQHVERRIATVVSMDVVGYSRMMGEDEVGTLAAIRNLRTQTLEPLFARYEGRLVKTMGDGFLVEFASAVLATDCALAIQAAMSAQNEHLPPKQQLVFRIGINLGELLIEDDDIFGNGVNLAARLEGMAEPGGILISQVVQDAVAGLAGADFISSGSRRFRNIAEPVRVWSWPRALPAVRTDRKPFVLVGDIKGGTTGEQQVADDLRADLLVALSRLTGLEVTADSRKADYVLAGTVRLAGARGRVSTQLQDVEDERQLWAERFDELAEDVFGFLDRCVGRIATTVRRFIAEDDARRIAGKSSDQLTLEQRLSLAGVSFFKPTREGWRTGGVVAEQALAQAPENFMALAMAAAGLGLEEWLYGVGRAPEAVSALAMQRTEAALRLTHRSDMLHTVHAGLLLYAYGRHREAIAAAERALAINADFNMALWMRGAALIFAGDTEAGIASAHRAVDINPVDPYVHLYSRVVAYGHFDAGRFHEAATWFEKADHLAPGVPPNLVGLIASRWRQGEHVTAREALDRLLLEMPDFRLSAVEGLPYRDPAGWAAYWMALRDAGAPLAMDCR